MAEAGGAAPAMRLDRFLWFARLAKTRSVAQAIACEGRMRIDGRAVDRAAAPVRAGNVLTFAHGARIRVVAVTALPVRRASPAAARDYYREIGAEDGTRGPRDGDERSAESV